MNVYVLYAFSSSAVACDVLANIRREENRKAQLHKNARKQRARELTKAREHEIKKMKGEAK